jgi:pimeloyl-ACP methyl ester carboxylesterase
MKYLQITLHLTFCALNNVAFGQTIKNDHGNVNNETFSYCYIEPAKEIKGVLILLPGWGESPQSIFEKTELPHLLSEKGFVTIVPQLHQTLFADEYTLSEIKEIIKLQSERYKTKKLNLVIGGLSAGGAIAIDYAEQVLEVDTMLKLKAVFAIDPPLDLIRMYTSAENKIKYNCKSKLIRKEGDFIKKHLLHALNGPPEERRGDYQRYSAFSVSMEDGGNARFLKNIPVRLYSEPDLEFVRKTYCDELQYEDINAIDLERMNKFLVDNGNKKAEYITTKGKGFHSWNILDPVECTNWILSLVN